ncbi:hypothetical protein ACIBCO_35015 [Streptomyces violascens]|uniref:hypothetical protein n=1 Tax=Streptomyces violascens TaxID=67381 RepID=UPI0037A20ADE
MNESRQTPLAGVGVTLGRAELPPALCGFLLLLALIFTASYAVGASAGPVAPGMHGTATSGGGGADVGDMGGMHEGGQ